MILTFSRFSILYIFTIMVLLNGCANRQAPQGGPVDITTPEIISTYPDSSQLRNFKDNYIKIVFDRYVDELSFKESIFISPSVGELEFDWSGTEVLITFSEKLRKNTTYVVNIGTDVKDRFINQRQMARAFTLAFSTGPYLDRGSIEGYVLPVKDSDQLSGIMIFAYLLDGINADTLNPQTSKPDFITQTGKAGDFFLHHVPFGNYRIFAIRDEYRNLIYDREIDEFAVPHSIISINEKDTLVSGILMKMCREDTTKPRLIKLTALNRNHLSAEFSESINSNSVDSSSFVVRDTTSQEQLNIVTIYPTSLSTLAAVTQDQDSNKTYRLVVQNVKDSVGNIISPIANSLLFTGSPKVDTLGPRLLQISIKDSSLGVSLLPVITLTFSTAMIKADSFDWINLYDNYGQIISAMKKWNSDISISIAPEKELKNKSWYLLRAELRKLKDWAGRVSRDSTKTWHFETLDLEDFSSIEGIVIDSNKTDNVGQIIVIAKEIGGKSANQYSVVADSNGRFIFPQVSEGKYTLQAYRDRNNNRRYDYGNPFPFSYSERLSHISEIFKVRARWPLEGLIITMK